MRRPACSLLLIGVQKGSQGFVLEEAAGQSPSVSACTPVRDAKSCCNIYFEVPHVEGLVSCMTFARKRIDSSVLSYFLSKIPLFPTSQNTVVQFNELRFSAQDFRCANAMLSDHAAFDP